MTAQELHRRARRVNERSTDILYAIRRPDVHEAATRKFWVAFHEFHDPLDDLPERMDAGDRDAVEAGIVYLESAPRCFRSGYLAERIMRHVARAELSDEQRHRCVDVVLASTRHRAARPWRYVGALAGGAWGDELQQRLNEAVSTGVWTVDDARKLVATARDWRGNHGLATETAALEPDLRRAPSSGNGRSRY